MLENKNVISIGNVNAWVVSVNDPMYQRAYPREVRKEVTVSYLLGTGAMGEVFLAFRKRDDKRMALKSLKEEHLDNPKNRESFMNEVGFFKTLKHPNIIRMYSFIETENHGLFIGLEYADKGDLFHLVKDRKGLDESTARYLYFQALKALEYLHEKDIAHRDIKLENFLLVSTFSSIIMKLADFGLAKLKSPDTNLKSFCGTPNYLAPEILRVPVRTHVVYTHMVDIWSLGCVLYTMLTCKMTFDKNDEDFIRNIEYVNYPPPTRRGVPVSAEAVDMMRQMISLSLSQILKVNLRLFRDRVK